MRLTDIEKHKVTESELHMIHEYMDFVSDMGEMCDGSFGIEWDGIYGKHWERFENEEEACKALDRYSDRCVALLPEVRKEMLRNANAYRMDMVAKGRRILAEKRFIKESKTLGGHCPELGELLVKMRNEYKKVA